MLIFSMIMCLEIHTYFFQVCTHSICILLSGLTSTSWSCCIAVEGFDFYTITVELDFISIAGKSLHKMHKFVFPFCSQNIKDRRLNSCVLQIRSPIQENIFRSALVLLKIYSLHPRSYWFATWSIQRYID